jgi:hypothetical protein
MTDEERERILAEARENVRSRDFPNTEARHEDPRPRREYWQRPEPEPKKREPKRDTNADYLDRRAQSDASWNEWADQKIANAIATERAFMREAIGGAIAEMLDEERQEYKRALNREAQDLKLELVKLQTILAEYRALFATSDRRSVLDLPNPLTTRNVN